MKTEEQIKERVQELNELRSSVIKKQNELRNLGTPGTLTDCDILQTEYDLVTHELEVIKSIVNDDGNWPNYDRFYVNVAKYDNVKNIINE